MWSILPLVAVIFFLCVLASGVPSGTIKATTNDVSSDSGKPMSKKRSIRVPLQFTGQTYYLNVTVDDQGPLALIADTGSSNIWVYSKACINRGNHRFVTIDDTSPPNTGSNNTVTLPYVSGNVTGIPSAASVAVGSATVENFPFVLATRVDPTVSGSSEDGIFGLGMAFRSNRGRKVPVWYQTAKWDKLYNRGKFHIYLPQNPEDPTAFIQFGGEVKDLKVSKNVVVVASLPNPAANWQLTVSRVSYGGKNLLGPTFALLDLGTTLTLLPSFATRAINSQLGGFANVEEQGGNLHVAACKQDSKKLKEDVIVRLNEVPFKIPVSELVTNVPFVSSSPSTADLCYCGIQPGRNSRIILLGANFMRGKVTTFKFGTSTIQISEIIGDDESSA